MPSPSPSLAARERAALADLLDELGPDAPTCCAGWRTAHLAAHVVVRDSRPDAGLGYLFESLPAARPLARWSHRLEDRLRESTGWPELVRRVRSGPAAWLPTAWPGLDRAINTTEFVIHHEDVRRARPRWSPRALPRADQDRLWPSAALLARPRAGRLPGALVLRRTDVPGAGKRIGRGSPETVVEGDPLELLLWAGGRDGVALVTVG